MRLRRWFPVAGAESIHPVPAILETQRLADVLPAASELPWLNVSDSLEILTLMALAGDQRFDKAAVRWIIGRLVVETPADGCR